MACCLLARRTGDWPGLDSEPMRPLPVYEPGKWASTAGLSRMYTLEKSNSHFAAPAVLGVTLHRVQVTMRPLTL